MHIKQQTVIPADVKINVLPSMSPKICSTPFWRKFDVKQAQKQYATGNRKKVKHNKNECDDCGTKENVVPSGSDELGTIYLCVKCKHQ